MQSRGNLDNEAMSRDETVRNAREPLEVFDKWILTTAFRCSTAVESSGAPATARDREPSCLLPRHL